MSGGGGGSETTRVEPPAYQLPYLQTGLGRADQLYGQSSQGQNVIPFSPYSEAAMGGTAARAAQGSPVTSAAQQYATRGLQGGFLGSNPWLDATFNRAADATQGRLATQFAGAGRNVGASQFQRAQELNDLATGIYGGNYQFERGMQQGLVPQAAGLANQDYVDLGQLGGVGQQVEGLAGEYANAPGNALQQYLLNVRGNDYGQTTTAPRQRGNSTAGLLGGLLGLGGLFG